MARPRSTMLAPALGVRPLPEPAPAKPKAEAAPSSSTWATIARETDPFARLQMLDAVLVRAGWHAMSPWWSFDLKRFYASGKRWGVYEVARGGGKSTTLERHSTCETMTAARVVPPGQRWPWLFLSAGMADARKRIVGIGAILGATGVEVDITMPSGQPTIATKDAHENDIAFVVTSATVAAVSGPTACGATVDEEQKLRDKVTNANPAHEVLAALIPTFRARDGIRAIRCSSAYDDRTTHAASIRAGDTEVNHIGRIGAGFVEVARAGFVEVAAWEEARGDKVAAARLRVIAEAVKAESPHVPTWVANPSISAVASRRELEALPPDALEGLTPHAFWLREFGSVLVPEAKAAASMSAEDLGALAAFNREAAPGRRTGMRPDGLLHVHGYDSAGRPGSDPSRYRGL